MSGRLSRYALFQARDYVRERGVPLLLVGALLLLMASQGAIGPGGVDLRGTSLGTLIMAAVFLELFAPTAVLIAVNGIVSSDRKHHYYRLLFAKPIAAPRYYGQAWLVSLLGTLVATLLVMEGFTLFLGAVPMAAALHFVLLYFILFGGVGFLLSAITEYDWVALGVVWSLAWLLRSWLPASESFIGRVVDVLLPPLQLLTGAAAPLLNGAGIDTASRIWIVGYGVAAFAIGLIVVRYRPMAS
jgi:ABC-type transport system involved in multi-copper enzyme maturation permease subunit